MQARSDERFADWDDERYSTDIDRFDEQHRRLFGLLNDLHAAMDEGHSEEEIGDILRELERYTEYHFGDEEEFMQDCGYAMDCADCFYDHREMHEEFAARVAEFREKHENGEYVTMEVLTFLRDWLDAHIAALDEDQNYADYFESEVDGDYEYRPGALRQGRRAAASTDRGDERAATNGDATAADEALDPDGPVADGGPLDVPEGTVADWFESVAEAHGDRPAALVPTADGYAERTFDDLVDRAQRVAAGLLGSGFVPGDRVGIAAESRYEWSVVDLACQFAGLVSVPLYPSFTAEQTRRAAGSAGLSGVVTDGGPADDGSADGGVRVDIDDLPTAEPGNLPGLRADGREPATVVFDPAGSDQAGHAFTHRALLAGAAALADDLPLAPGSTGTCFLPLAHVYQRVATYYLWSTGSAVAYAGSGGLVDDLAAVRPSVLVGTPAVYQRLYGALQDRIGSMNWMKRKVAGRVASYGRDRLDGGGTPLKYAAADRLVYGPLREAFGLADLEYALCGAGRLDAHLLYLFAGFGLPVRNLFGTVGTAGVGALATPEASVDGAAGRPVGGTEIARSDGGELLVRGPVVTVGRPGADETARRPDRWCRTGTDGRVGSDGTVYVE
ncbi:bacteriohemerythrin [Halosimplex pelagicum]|uniref:Bacteriohemerythrin n=1 Tax=Halosimplex pelagicum TaxID=869886 RepID=A0A7D5TC09_9EURY|nr:bacteriohemerythrin [Halosimplex pelagicum]QLH84210.1 bacteriohemerythrin [Halosimplex pelagicum]